MNSLPQHNCKSFTTVKLINMNTSEEIFKCCLFNFSLNYATENFTICKAQLYKAVQGYISQFRKLSFTIKTLTRSTQNF